MSDAPRREIPTRDKPVDVRAIERELADLLAPERPGDDPVTRACMSNLIIYCDTSEQAQALPEEIARIVHRHPARVLLLVAAAGADGPELEAWVSAHCYLAGGGKQICSEHVTVSARGGATRRLPSTARSLLIGDLPTSFWWATPTPPPRGACFPELSEMARHVIFDSVAWTDPVHDLVAAAEWVRGSDAIVSDLAWRRLKPWRRSLSQTLDPALLPGALDGIEEVVVEHGPHALSQAWLLVGWLVCALGWDPAGGAIGSGSELHFDFRSRRGPLRVSVRRLPEGESELRSVSIRWKAGGRPGGARFAPLGPGRIGIAEAGSAPERWLATGAGARADLVARQLPKLFGDGTLRDAFGASHAMAEAILR